MGGDLFSKEEEARRAKLLDPYPEPIEDVTPQLTITGNRDGFHEGVGGAFTAPPPSTVGPPCEPVRISDEQRLVLRQEAIKAAAVEISDSALYHKQE